MSEQSVSMLRALVGSELSTVAFIRDYLQLAFEESQIGQPEPGVLRAPTTGTAGRFSAFTMPELKIDGRQLRSEEPGYRDALVEQIGRRVTDANEDDERLWFEFESGVVVTVSLAEDDLEGVSVESAELRLNDDGKSWMVWRPHDRQS